jgi:hypothetical protein
MVFYCERASDFSNTSGFADEAYFIALLKMFEAALKISITLQNDRKRFSDPTLMLARATRQTSRLFGGKVSHI